MEVILHEVDPEIDQAVRAFAEARLKEAVRIEEKQARYDAIDAIKDETKEHFAAKDPENYPEQEKMIGEVLGNIVKDEVRRLITEEKFVRMDGLLAKFARFPARQASCPVRTVPRCSPVVKHKL